MPSVSNHSPATAGVSRAGFPTTETAGEIDLLAELSLQSGRVIAALLDAEADPRRQAAIAELSAASARAADALLAQRQAVVSLSGSGDFLP